MPLYSFVIDGMGLEEKSVKETGVCMIIMHAESYLFCLPHCIYVEMECMFKIPHYTDFNEND